MKFVLFAFLLFTASQADSDIKSIIEKEYEAQSLQYKFDNYVDMVVEEKKEPEEAYDDDWWDTTINYVSHYTETVGANYGVDIKSIAEEMMDNIFKSYGDDLNEFVNSVIGDDKLIKEIKNNYNEYITQSSTLIYTELNYDFKNKYLSIYNADTLNVLLKEDIKEKILKTKTEIVNNVKSQVVGNQPTTLAIAGGMIISGAIMKQVTKQIQKKTTETVLKRILGKVGIKLGSKAIPILGELLAAYELLTVNEIYEQIGEDIKEEFHNNEQIIINNIADTLSDIDNVSAKYQASISDIATDYVLKAKVPFTYIKPKDKSYSKLFNSENFIFLEVLESFYGVPEKYYKFLLDRYFVLPEEKKHLFVAKVKNLDDPFILENILFLEKETGIKIDTMNIFDMANALDLVELDNVAKFYNFATIVKGGTVGAKDLFLLYEPYQLLKNDDYLMKKYASLGESDRKELLEVVKEGKTDFGKIAYFESKYNVNIPSSEYVFFAKLFAEFHSFKKIDMSLIKYQENFGKIDLNKLKTYLQPDAFTRYSMIIKGVIINNIALLLLLGILFMFLISYLFYRKKYNKELELHLLSSNIKSDITDSESQTQTKKET